MDVARVVEAGPNLRQVEAMQTAGMQVDDVRRMGEDLVGEQLSANEPLLEPGKLRFRSRRSGK